MNMSYYSYTLNSELSPAVPGKPRVGLTFETEVQGKPRVGLTLETEVAGKPHLSHVLEIRLTSIFFLQITVQHKKTQSVSAAIYYF